VKSFSLSLRDVTRGETIDGVTSFVGEDETGSFGLLGGHARFMTSLVFGLARFRTGSGQWHYLAVPGALLYFADDVLQITTQRYLLDDDYGRVSGRLRDELLLEEKSLREVKASLRQMEDELFRRLWQLGREYAR